jgi:hypothetical protein
MMTEETNHALTEAELSLAELKTAFNKTACLSAPILRTHFGIIFHPVVPDLSDAAFIQGDYT